MYDWELTDPIFNLWTRLRQTMEAIERAMAIELDLRQTTLPQIDILILLSRSKVPLSVSEIASVIFRETQTTSELIARMQKLGYVKKTRGKSDLRTIKVRLLPKGEELLKEAVGCEFAYVRQMIKSSLSEEEVSLLDGLLKKLRDTALVELGLDAKPLPEFIDAQAMLRH